MLDTHCPWAQIMAARVPKRDTVPRWGRVTFLAPPSSILTPLFSKHNVHLLRAVNGDSVAVQVQRDTRGQLSNVFCYVRGGRNVTGVSNKVTCAFLFSLCASWCCRVRIGVWDVWRILCGVIQKTI